MSLNKGLFQGMSNLSFRKVLSRVKKVPFRGLPLPHLMGSNSDITENQYRKISHIDWAETSIFSDSSIPKNSGVLFKAIASLTIAIPFKSLQTTASAAFFCQFQMLVLKGLTLSGHLFQKQEVQLNVH